MKYKVGDKVRITGNNNHHGIPIGDIVTISAICTDFYVCLDKWSVLERDCELVTTTKAPKTPQRKHKGYEYADGMEITPDKIIIGSTGYAKESLETHIEHKAAELKTLKTGLRRFNDQNKRGWK
jgi:hypothetical protein